MEHNELRKHLLEHLEAGSLEARVVLPALRALGDTEQPRPSRWELLRTLQDVEGAEFEPIRRSLLRTIFESMSRANAALHSGSDVPSDLVDDLDGLPVGAPRKWREGEQSAADATKLLRIYEGLAFATAHAEPLLSVRKHLGQELANDPRPSGIAPTTLVTPRTLLARMPEGDERTSVTPWVEALVAQEVDAALRDPDVQVAADEYATLQALRSRFLDSADREEQRAILDRVLEWPSALAVTVLSSLCEQRWAQDRATLMLELRFGPPGRKQPQSWTWWHKWLDAERAQLDADRARVTQAIVGREATVLRHWYASQPDCDSNLLAELEDWSRGTLPKISADEFLRRYSRIMLRKEVLAVESAAGIEADVVADAAPVPPLLLGDEVASVERDLVADGPDEVVGASDEVTGARSAAPRPPPRPPPRPTPEVVKPAPREPVPREPALPSFWTRHLQAYFAENWFMVAGILMVVAGASILAYFTWDQHWLIRYTIMPTLLGGFTFALAAVGRFLEKREEDLKNAAAILRGAAIGLLPINFMAVTFLWDDASVPSVAVPAMAVLYLVVFGWGLRAWCAAVHPALKWLAGGTLLFLNFLVFLRPLGSQWLSVSDEPMFGVLAAGFHIGFLSIALAVVVFSERVLTADLAREKRVPWFFGLALGITYLQVFAWVHGLAGILPPVHTYGPMLVLAGGLVLYLERKGLELRGKRQTHEVESFLGFALILLGVLMAAGHDVARVVALLLAGAVWTHQAAKRDQDVHRWIGLTLLFLGGAAVGLHSSFPRAWLPAVGLGCAAAFALASRRLLAADPADKTAAIAKDMPAPILLLTAVVAVVCQWTEGSPPLWTAGALAIIAACFVIRAITEQRVRWLFTAMVMLATALPYVGCVDLGQRTWHGNTMVFGLAVLSSIWIGVTALIRTPLVRGARSTVLWTYGAIAVAAMIVRVCFEPESAADADSMRVFMNTAGPLLMALVLGVATYTSRSIVPAFMAMLIVVILFPELKARFDQELKSLGWGSGIGSAVNALWMTFVCFALRGWARLKDLGPGDRFLGRYAFPLVRTDYKLFTWPLMVSALFLLVRTNTITYGRNVMDMTWLPCVALGLAGVAWIAQAVYHRKRPMAVVGTHLGWLSLLLALAHALPAPHGWESSQAYFATLLGALVGLYVLFRVPPIGSPPWSRALLATPVGWVLAWATILCSFLWICIVLLVGSRPLPPWTALVLAALALWQGIRTRWMLFGALLFAVCGVYVYGRFAGRAPLGLGSLASAANIWYLLATQVVLLACAFWPRGDASLKPVRLPVQALSAGVLLFVGLGVAATGMLTYYFEWTGPRGALCAGLLLAAWSVGSSAWVLVAALVGFGFIPGSWLGRHAAAHISILGAVIAAASLVGLYAERARPQWLRSRLAWDATHLARVIPWLPGPAMLLALAASVMHARTPVLHNSVAWTWIPYLSAATLAAMALRTRLPVLYGLATVVLSAGNVLAVRALFGEQLAAWGLSSLHIVCLGLVVTLAELTALGRAIRSFRIRTILGLGCLALAGIILLFLSANYLAHPNLREIRWQRFAISGLTAVLAGLYFRNVARSPGAGIKPYVRLAEGLYHYALALAIGCFALLVPFLRTPATAMFALGMPALYFYGRAELLHRTHAEISARYRNSARVTCYILLVLYVLRPTFQMVFFPHDPVQVFSYHWNAPLVMLLGVMMIRLRGLGAVPWLDYFGGFALILGSYFLLTWLPGLSPFTDPVPAAWCAVVLSHFWMVVSSSRSPLRTSIQRMGRLGDDVWNDLRATWGTLLLVGVHVAAIWGLSNCAPEQPRAFAPLLAGLTTVVVHHAILRGNRWILAVGGLQALIALHAGFFIESVIGARAVVWIVLGLWSVGLALHARIGRRVDVRVLQVAAGALIVLCLGHALYHQWWSAAGLWIVALATALVSLTPQLQDRPANDAERWGAGGLLLLPIWLTYFVAVGRSPSLFALVGPWPLGLATFALVLVAVGLRWGATHLSLSDRLLTPGTPRLLDHTRALVVSVGKPLGVILVWTALGVTVLLHAVHGTGETAPRTCWVLLALYGAIAWEGWQSIAARKPGRATLLVEVSIAGALTAARALIVQARPGVWIPEYDVWAVLLVSMILAGTREYLERRSPEIRRALLPAIFALPLFAIVWTLAQGLGTDVLLVVVGLQSLLFSYMGRDEGESPFRIIAVVGFVAFVLITFHAKLEFRDAHAYVIPVALGVLALVQLLRNQMSVETRNRVRAAAHLSMLGSSGYYAVADGRHPITFNITLFLLCLASMGAGALLRVRLFLVLGFAGLVVSLASILARTLNAMGRTMRLTSVGLLVLLVGVIFVMGTVYYKTHRERVNATLARWRQRLGEWE